MFSVVIPLYNKVSYIKRAIDSVLNQKFQNFEIVVIDDGSTDKSHEIVEGFTDPRIKLIRQKNKGESAARNKGVKEAKYNLIAFLDADDEWLPSFLEDIYKLINDFPGAGIYACAYKNEKGILGGNLRGASIDSIVENDGIIPNFFRMAKNGYHILSASSVVVSKEVIIKTGGFNEEMWWGPDDDLWSRIAFSNQIVYTKKINVIYYENIANSAYRKKRIVEYPPFIDFAHQIIQSNNVPDDLLNDIKEYAEYNEVSAARHNIQCGYYVTGIKILMRLNTRFENRKKIIRYLLSGFRNQLIN